MSARDIGLPELLRAALGLACIASAQSVAAASAVAASG